MNGASPLIRSAVAEVIGGMAPSQAASKYGLSVQTIDIAMGARPKSLTPEHRAKIARAVAGMSDEDKADKVAGQRRTWARKLLVSSEFPILKASIDRIIALRDAGKAPNQIYRILKSEGRDAIR